MSSWRETLEQRLGGEMRRTAAPEAARREQSPDDTAPAPDPNEYHPWLLQRGRGRPAMFLDLRRFEPRTGILMGCQMSYPHLFAVDYLGDRMVSLDFGTRQFVIEGAGLSQLPQWIQQGMVLAIQEYASSIWPVPPQGPVVKRIVQIEAKQGLAAPGAGP